MTSGSKSDEIPSVAEFRQRFAGYGSRFAGLSFLTNFDFTMICIEGSLSK
jgi:hypothetical protein